MSNETLETARGWFCFLCIAVPVGAFVLRVAWDILVKGELP